MKAPRAKAEAVDKVIKSKVVLWDDKELAAESLDSKCFVCLERPALPNLTYCRECVE
jgi:hypothetical protein